jgi:hypothetical protein
MTSHEFGKRLQDQVADMFKDIFPKARSTSGSGNRGEHGDVQQPWFIIECKARFTDSITISRNVWRKLNSDIPIGSKRLPLYIIENKHGEQFAVLSLVDFIDIFKRSIKEEK